METEKRVEITKSYLEQLTRELTEEAKKKVQDFTTEGMIVAQMAETYSEVELIIDWLKSVSPRFSGLIDKIVTTENWEKVKMEKVKIK